MFLYLDCCGFAYAHVEKDEWGGGRGLVRRVVTKKEKGSDCMRSGRVLHVSASWVVTIP
jgi:hypothetical protein